MSIDYQELYLAEKKRREDLESDIEFYDTRDECNQIIVRHLREKIARLEESLKHQMRATRSLKETLVKLGTS